MRQLRRPLRALAALALVAFGLSGCMKLDMDLTVNSNDTLDGTVVVALDRSLLMMSGKSPEEAFEGAEDSVKDLPKGSRTEVYDDGKFYGKKIIYDDLSFAAFNSGKADAPHIEHADGKYTFTADLKTGSNSLGAQAELMRPFLSGIQITIALTFPGDVVEHDAQAKVDGHRVSWNLGLGENNRLRAVAEEGPAFPLAVVAVVGGVAGLAVVVGIVVLAIWLSRRHATPAPAATPAYPAAAPTDPAYPATYADPHPATHPGSDPTPPTHP
ncbi:hypothetical protein Cs7R123_24840 [Catellatospora sp. TT07R-123]|uniref:LppM family (lipo)protein n=1 Tax=Catellatospora sp. TT07R-123 TaxID=2733863 RepID=UPI001B22B33D|nr:hypothetical protein [Catellatospora sp. TT07R-123]GHJ45142.1 hypothetical protein Cs7R123_24840 [Catellatospora sp. TT07R-123]